MKVKKTKLSLIKQNWLSYVVLIPWCLFTIGIFLWLLLAALKTNQELYENMWGIPKTLILSNFSKAWSVAHIGNYFGNSLFVVGVSVLLTLLIGGMGAYALARKNFFGNNVILYSLIAGMGVPVQLIIVPLFMLLNSLKLTNHHFGLIIAYISYSLPFTTFLLASFFRTLPTELEESAALDGASDLIIFWRIVVPISAPAFITAAIFNFISLWNEYLLALVLLGNQDQWTVSLGLYNLRAVMGSTADWTALFAGVVIILIPSFLLYVFLSDRVIAGMTLGATKG